MLYWIGRSLSRLLFKATCRLEVVGRENLPATGGVIIAPNHISHLDPPLVGAALSRSVYFMAKRELFEVPIFGWIIRQTHAFPVSRGTADRQAIRQAQKLLESGEVLVIFPEGKRSPDGRLQAPELGLAMIAARAGVPVVPMALTGTNYALPRGSVCFRPARIRVTIGAPQSFASMTNSEFSRQTLQEFSDKIMNEIQRMLPAEMQGAVPRAEVTK